MPINKPRKGCSNTGGPIEAGELPGRSVNRGATAIPVLTVTPLHLFCVSGPNGCAQSLLRTSLAMTRRLSTSGIKDSTRRNKHSGKNATSRLVSSRRRAPRHR